MELTQAAPETAHGLSGIAAGRPRTDGSWTVSRRGSRSLDLIWQPATLAPARRVGPGTRAIDDRRHRSVPRAGPHPAGRWCEPMGSNPPTPAGAKTSRSRWNTRRQGQSYSHRIAARPLSGTTRLLAPGPFVTRAAAGSPMRRRRDGAGHHLRAHGDCRDRSRLPRFLWERRTPRARRDPRRHRPDRIDGRSSHSGGANFIHSPDHPEHERAVVDLLLEKQVRRVSASAFMALSPDIVRPARRRPGATR